MIARHGKSPTVIGTAMAALFLGLLAGPAGAATADVDCPAFPEVSWWGGLNHQKVVYYVARKHGGDWLPYVAKWQRELAKLKDIHARGSAASFRKHGVRLKGPRLAEYIGKVEKRVSINRCLAYAPSTSPDPSDDGNGLAPAAGAPEDKLSGLQGQSLGDRIRRPQGGAFTAVCRDGTITRMTPG